MNATIASCEGLSTQVIPGTQKTTSNHLLMDGNGDFQAFFDVKIWEP